MLIPGVRGSFCWRLFKLFFCVMNVLCKLRKCLFLTSDCLSSARFQYFKLTSKSTYFNFKFQIVKIMEVPLKKVHQHYLPCQTGSLLHLLVCLCIAYTVCLLRGIAV